jgi:hypothetical protein
MRLLALGAIAAGLALGSCATEQQIVQGKEDMLAAAGFTLRPAETPERTAELARRRISSFTRPVTARSYICTRTRPSATASILARKPRISSTVA